MRDKVIAISAVAIAGVAVVVGLSIGALGGAFDDTSDSVQPPALRSDLSTVVSATSSSVITVPPSPTWQVAVPTTPKPTTTEPTTTRPTTTTQSRTPGSETTSRSPRNRGTTTETDSDSDSEDTTTTR
jgi:hypothetical protein